MVNDLPYNIFMAPSALKYYKKFSDSLKQKVKNEAMILAKEPYKCDELHEPLKNIRSYHFSYEGKEYRIAYLINENTKSINIILVKTRENFYNRLIRII
jgi:mRNA-degrading endonuclease RelE of RelBE toxin-antitoxin system